MMNRKFSSLILLAILLVACSPKQKKMQESASLEAEIVAIQDSLRLLQNNPEQFALKGKDMQYRLADELEKFYRLNRKTEKAPEALMKIHMLYSGVNNYTKAAEYGDTLLLYYPKYKDRPVLLESMASIYDMDIVPRDTTKIRFYYQILLDENKGIDAEQRENTIERLQHLDLPFETYVQWKIGKNNGK